MCKKILTYSVFDKKLTFFDYFEQSGKNFFIFAFNFIHVVALVLILRSDQGGLTIGSCLLAKFHSAMSIINLKKANKHTGPVSLHNNNNS